MVEDTNDSRPARDLALPLRIVVGAAFAMIVFLTTLQIFFRSVLDSPLVWSEELVQLLLVWVVFLGAAVVCWDGQHLKIDIVLNRMPPRLRNAVDVFNTVVALAVLIILAVGAVPLIRLNMGVDMSALGIPLSWVRAPALVGGGLMAGFVLLRRFYRIPHRSDHDAAEERHTPFSED